MSAPEALLEVENLKVARGGVSVLDIPSLSLYEREVVTVVGPNGSGKSTLLLTLACLLKPLAGRLLYRRGPLNTHKAVFQYRRRISMAFQEPLLFDTTACMNVAAGLKIRGTPRKDARERAMQYLKYFHSEHLADRSARKLSGGESQRISLARAFAVEPQILFLDEPFSALDPPTKHALIHDLEKIVRETGTTTVMVTQIESEALSMSSRIVVMNGGKIVQTGVPSAVMNNPINEFVARFVGMETILKGRVLECREGFLVISVSGKELHAVGQAQPEDEVTCCIRPENVAINAGDADASGGWRNVFAGRLEHIYSMGPYIKLIMDCGFPLISLVSGETFASAKLAEGNTVYASFKPASVYVLKTGIQTER